MLKVCPLCNQMETRSEECERCHLLMDDRGRIMDYFDDYSAYLDIDGMKQVDGYEDDGQNHQCPHIFYCTQCTHNQVLLVNEVEM
jgi:hypothetical protein